MVFTKAPTYPVKCKENYFNQSEIWWMTTGLSHNQINTRGEMPNLDITAHSQSPRTKSSACGWVKKTLLYNSTILLLTVVPRERFKAQGSDVVIITKVWWNNVKTHLSGCAVTRGSTWVQSCPIWFPTEPGSPTLTQYSKPCVNVIWFDRAL